VLALLLAMLIIALISSTREGRAVAREWIKPLERRLLIPAVVLWVLLLWPALEQLAS